MKISKFLLTLSLSLGAIISSAQFNSVAFHLGGMNIQGEAASFDWNNPYDLSDVGLDAGFSFIKTLQNEQWRIVVEGNYQTGQHIRNWGTESNPTLLGSRFRSSSILIGSRYVLNPMVNRYHYYAGQFLPFVGVSFGASSVSAEVSGDEAFIQSFTTLQGTELAPVGEVQVGAELVVYENVRLFAMGAMRITTSDYMDGIEGSTGLGDVIYRGVIGASYDFN